MPRYYDLDKLERMIEAKVDTLVSGKEAFLSVAKWLSVLPCEDMVKKAVEKQDAKKPCDIEDEWCDRTLSCSTCKNPVIFSSGKFKPPHCIMCGQKFDWSTEGDRNGST